MNYRLDKGIALRDAVSMERERVYETIDIVLLRLRFNLQEGKIPEHDYHLLESGVLLVKEAYLRNAKKEAAR